MPLLTITQYCRYRFVHRVRVSTFTLSLDQQRVANYSPKSDSEVLFFRFTSCCCNSCKRRHCCSAAIWAPLYKNWVLDHYQLRQLNWGLLHQNLVDLIGFESSKAESLKQLAGEGKKDFTLKQVF